LIFSLQGVFRNERRKGMFGEHHQKVWIQNYLYKMAPSAFHTQNSSIPLFHHSMWLAEENGHKKQ
jgi:hypothetical protein